MVVGQAVEQAVKVLDRLGPALSGQGGRLVEHDPGAPLGKANAWAKALSAPLRGLDDPFRTPSGPFGGRGLGRGDPQALPWFQPVAGRRPLAIDPELPGAGPARDGVETDIGQVAPKPAVEADAVIILADGKRPHIFAGRLGRGRPLAGSVRLRHCPIVEGLLLKLTDESGRFR